MRLCARQGQRRPNLCACMYGGPVYNQKSTGKEKEPKHEETKKQIAANEMKNNIFAVAVVVVIIVGVGL